ncbi:DEAD/DEAH box helicase [Enterococcus sp. HY326]|uniref:DEAD/DEAH box helicase n=1 Tax=Enterococcus sp. HY326 TaxID=2971265 RepID=UPI002240E139|nr:DEAD/DEAH box helicase [Enterococcus sp. HY326]
MSFITELPEKWQALWQQKGFSEPSIIQSQTYHPLKAGQNLLGISPTGSGKTLAYLLPSLQKVTTGQGMQLLILTSSQELSIQVFEVAKEWGEALGLKTQAVIGGANVKRQIDKLKERPEVLVGTPGRVLELIKQKKIKAHQIQTLIFDEADQLLGEVLPQQIIKTVNQQSQFAFFSATGQKVIAEVKELRPDIQIIDVSQNDQSTSGLEHYYLKVTPRKRGEELRRLANVSEMQSLVFFNELSDLGDAEEKLLYRQLPVASLASDQNKLLRKAAIENFKKQQLTLLLTTDLAARGLDIENLPLVINYDIPTSEESYLHRAGRTGRMGKKGQVITFVHEGNFRDYQRLLKSVGVEGQEIFLYGAALHHEASAENKQRSEQNKKNNQKGINKGRKKVRKLK